MRDHQLRIDAECRSAFRGIKSGEPAARSRTKVVKAPAILNAAGDLIDRMGEARDLCPHGRDRVAVLVVHQLEQLDLAHAVETCRVAVHLFAQGRIASAAAMAQTRAAPLVAT